MRIGTHDAPDIVVMRLEVCLGRSSREMNGETRLPPEHVCTAPVLRRHGFEVDPVFPIQSSSALVENGIKVSNTFSPRVSSDLSDEGEIHCVRTGLTTDRSQEHDFCGPGTLHRELRPTLPKALHREPVVTGHDKNPHGFTLRICCVDEGASPRRDPLRDQLLDFLPTQLNAYVANQAYARIPFGRANRRSDRQKGGLCPPSLGSLGVVHSMHLSAWSERNIGGGMRECCPICFSVLPVRGECEVPFAPRMGGALARIYVSALVLLFFSSATTSEPGRAVGCGDRSRSASGLGSTMRRHEPLEEPMDIRELAALVTVVAGIVVIFNTMRGWWTERRKAREERRHLIASIAGPAPDELKLQWARQLRYTPGLERFTP